MDTINPFQSHLHAAAERTLTLQREAAALYEAQLELAEKQTVALLDGVRAGVVAQRKASLAMSEVLVDAMKPATAPATAPAA